MVASLTHEPQAMSPGAQRCFRKFKRYFPDGFRGEKFCAWERDYKLAAHRRFADELGAAELRNVLRTGDARELAARAASIEGRTNLLFSFEKMALRDGVRDPRGAKTFVEALLALEEETDRRASFEAFADAIASLPHERSRVFTWPVVTVFPFIVQPKRHIFLKPNVTRRAARAYGFDFDYAPRPAWSTYSSLLTFASRVQRDLRVLSPGDAPRDMIDVQSFLWVMGSDEYP